MAGGWQFWIDRGGTFTDVVAKEPSGKIVVHKLLSDAPQQYKDPVLAGIRAVMGIAAGDPLPCEDIASVRVGTTLATNALLQRTGARTLLLTTAGFRDALRIGYQNRPDIFALKIVLPDMLYEDVVEIDERISASGETLTPINLKQVQRALLDAIKRGIDSCAIVFMHGYKYPAHEFQAEQLARDLGFPCVSASHAVIPVMKFVSRGDTTVADAYLSPVLRRYRDRLTASLDKRTTRLYFMQSNGGLCAASQFSGKNSILSGPAGGIVGAVKTALAAGEHNVLSFDMGGTSTDVAHYAGVFERNTETLVGGVRLRVPMLAIETVAAGGGSLLKFDQGRLLVGPDSAGAQPGPACYRRGGPLTVTDCNVMLGRIQPDYFPSLFGPDGCEPLDAEIVGRLFAALAQKVADSYSQSGTAFADGDFAAERLASGFLSVAIQKMANAIKQVSTARGRDPSDYTLVCFGGAGGQHACAIADLLGIKKILIHPLAGVLSALGIGLADLTVIKEKWIDELLTPANAIKCEVALDELEQHALDQLAEGEPDFPGTGQRPRARRWAFIKYEGSDFALQVPWNVPDEMASAFAKLHAQRFGFLQPNKRLIIERIEAEVAWAAMAELPQLTVQPATSVSPDGEPKTQPQPHENLGQAITRKVWFSRSYIDTPVFSRGSLPELIRGPALIMEPTSTIVVEPGWQAQLLKDGSLMLKPQTDAGGQAESGSAASLYAMHGSTSQPDPVLLELFNNLFMFIAEQMGTTLQNTSHSVNIKERLDFSCALFDGEGNLVSNAPHIPVHLGSMGESVQELIARVGAQLQPGDVYALNDPFNGGTHLPDITAITGYFAGTPAPLFYLAARGHHADVGGITPGSMPPFSKTIDEEGVLLDMVKVATAEEFLSDELRAILTAHKYPARNPEQNIADMAAQVAALRRGILELDRAVERHGLQQTQRYMQFMQENAEAAVKQLLSTLPDGEMRVTTDSGASVCVSVQIDRSNATARIDFAGTSPQQSDNMNAPLAITKAAVLYVLRTLVQQDIPLNAGCLKPIEIIVPRGCFLNPVYPAAVVAGNVETSQVIVDALFGAVGQLAASQGTMNNFTFGNAEFQYYETICGGAGAGADFNGADAVHTHMTNSRLTDPEVLESRFPVRVEQFAVRAGSGGQGAHSGGNGVVRKIRFLQPMTAGILSNRRSTRAFGLQGGADGLPGRNVLERADKTVHQLAACAEVEVAAGDVFVIETPGGGGFGQWNS